MMAETMTGQVTTKISAPRRVGGVFLLLFLAFLSGSPAAAQTGVMSTVVGAAGSATFGSLNMPAGVAADASGNLYIADTNNCVVWELPSGAGALTLFAGQLGDCAALNHPIDVAVCHGSVFIADTASTSPPSTGLIQVANGLFTPLKMNFNSARNVLGLVQPQAIACDNAGDLFVQSVYTTGDTLATIYTLDVLTAEGVSANIASTLGIIYQGIAVDSGGNVYSAGNSLPGQQSIHKFTSSAFPNNWAETPLTQSRFLVSPTRIAVDALGNFYVTEGVSPSQTTPTVYLTRVSPTGGGPYSVASVAGTGTAGFNGDAAAVATSLQLNGPTGLAAGPSGILIADTGNNRIREFSAANVQLSFAPPSPVAFPTPVTLTATVELNGNPAPGGAVTFLDNESILGAAQIVRDSGAGGVLGTATLVTRFGVGTHSLSATYQGPGAGLTARALSLPLVVSGSASTATSVTAQTDTANPANFDFSATVFGFGFTPPGGTVNFSAGSASLVSAPLTPASLQPTGISNAFLPLTPFSNMATPIAAGDLNGDGIPDLVVFDDTSADGTTMGILIGKGDGTYQPEVTSCLDEGQPKSPPQPGACSAARAFQPVAAFIADVNGDGTPDVIVLDSTGIGVFLGTGGGALNPMPLISGGGAGNSLAIGDVNLDGFPDLVVTDTSRQTVNVLLGTATGLFNVSQGISVTGAGQTVIADFNHDGKPDLATSNYLVPGQPGSPDSVSIMLGNGDGTFGPPAALAGPFNLPHSLLAADLNGDGYPDLAVLNTGSNQIGIFLNTEQWSGSTPGFQNSQNLSTVSTPGTIVAADFNGDGYPDLAVGVGDNSIGLFLNAGAGNPGNFNGPQNYPSLGGAFGLVQADLNGDSVPDLAAAGEVDGFVQTSILLGGSESFAALIDVAVPGGSQTVTAAYAPGISSNYSPSSGAVALAPGKALGTLTLTLPKNIISIFPGSTFSIDALFAPPSNSTPPLPTGNITVTAVNGSTSVSQTGPAPFSYSPDFPQGEPVNLTLPGVGVWQVTATYGGDSNWQSATSNTLPFTALQAQDKLTLNGSSTANAGVQYSAVMEFSNLSPGAPAPSGNITITGSNGSAAPVTLSTPLVSTYNGSLSPVSWTFPNAGAWVVTASYPGNAAYAPASTMLTVAVTGSTAPLLSVATASLPADLVGTSYSQPLAAAGGTPPYSWRVTAGTLPPGLLLVPITGVITGTPGIAGTFSFTVTVFDSSSSQQSATANLSISIIPATVTISVTEKITVGDQVTVTPLINFAGPAASFSTSGLGFNGTSGVQTLTLSNVGEAPLVFSGSPSISPGFTITPTLCSSGATSLPLSLPSGGSCAFTISWTGAPPTGTIIFTDNAALSNPPSTPAGSLYMQTIALSGAGSGAGPLSPPSATVTVAVGENIAVGDIFKKTPAVVWPAPVAITYGTVLSASQLNATANVQGSFVYTPGIGTVLPAGNGKTLSVTFTPTDTADYTTATATTTINVNKATPIITWPAPAAITFGGALSLDQLNAMANVPGAFVYSPSTGTVLPVGNGQTLSATFTPSDATDYTTAAASTTINVNPAQGQRAAPVNLVVTNVMTRTGGNVVIQLTIANTGGTAAANVVLAGVKVGADTATPLPQNLGAIGAGGSARATVTVPGSVGVSGALGSLTVSGIYTGGTFSSSARITLP